MTDIVLDGHGQGICLSPSIGTAAANRPIFPDKTFKLGSAMTSHRYQLRGVHRSSARVNSERDKTGDNSSQSFIPWLTS